MTAIDIGLSSFLLALARFAPLWLVPALSPFAWMPAAARLPLLLAIAMLAVAAAPSPAVAAVAATPAAFGTAMAGELVLGLGLSLAVVLPMAALDLPARMVDLQSGVAAANVLNPATRGQQSLAGTVLAWGGTVVFFASGLHLVLLRGMVESVRWLPPGAGRWLMAPETFLALLSSQFLLGLTIVAPVVLGLFAIDLVVAYASRSMPQANIYFVALPVKVLAGFLLLAQTLRFAPPMIERLYRHAFFAVGIR